MSATEPASADAAPVDLRTAAQAFALEVVTRTPYGTQPEAFLLLLSSDGTLRKVPTTEYTRTPGGSLPPAELRACARARIHPAAPYSWDATICDRWHPEVLITTCDSDLRESACAADITRHDDGYGLGQWQEVDISGLEGWETALEMLWAGSLPAYP